MAARIQGYAQGADLLLAFSLKVTGSGQSLLAEEHRFASGDSVTVCRGNPQDKRLVEGRDRFDGLIIRVDAHSLYVKISGSVDLPANVLDDTWRLDRGANAVSTERQKNALLSFSQAAAPDSPCDMWLKALLLDDAELMAELRADPVKVARDSPQGLPTAFFRSETGEIQTESEDLSALLDDARLNDSQRHAVVSALSQRLTLIQGPPGTGKTHASVQLLKLFVAHQRHAASALASKKKGSKGSGAAAAVLRQSTVLATANSNTAADNLLEGLLAQGVKAVRAGQAARVRPHLQSACMEHKIEGHAARKVEKQLEDMVRELSTDLRDMKISESGGDDGSTVQSTAAASPRTNDKKKKKRGRHAEMGAAMAFDQAAAAYGKPKTKQEMQDKLQRARTQLDELRKQMIADIVSSTEVVVATCIAAGELADSGLFKVVLIDEASQSTVPTCLVPISKGCQQLVLVGDSNQLPPTVKTDRGMQGGLNRSLFESLQDMGVPSIMLNTQYRMHPEIASFPSTAFYKGELLNAEVVHSLVPPAGFEWPIGNNTGEKIPVAFVPSVGFDEQVTLDGTSKSNLSEATAVMETLRELLDGGELLPEHIGVVTPYRGQVELIQKLLTSEDRFEGVEVNSVDGYQGREKEMIILSSVRANEDGKVGFLADWRRLNVALTRAKRGIVVFGSVPTLRNDPVWSAWIDHMQLVGAYHGDAEQLMDATAVDLTELEAALAEAVAGEQQGELASSSSSSSSVNM